jgi:iron-sulfur cluster assembly accessory protein
MVTLTEKAAKKVIALAQAQKKPEPILRVKVGAGGCSGMSYTFELVDAVAPTDVVFAGHGAKAVVDPRSDFFVGGSEVDFHETLMEAKFKIQNPLAKSSCSCGTSFNV